MKIFFAISAIALVLESGAQLSNLPRRLRAVDARQEVVLPQLQQEPQQVVEQVVEEQVVEQAIEQEQRDLKNNNDRKDDKQKDKVKNNKTKDKKKKDEKKRPEKNNNPVPPPQPETDMSAPTDLCSNLTKKHCKNDDACIWDGGECFEVPEDLCAPLSKNLCRRYDTCNWNGSTCFGANHRVLASSSVEVSVTTVNSQRRLGSNNKNSSNTQVSCDSLGKNKCNNNDICTWNKDDHLCFTAAAPEMSMPLDQCASLGRKKCKRNDACTWNSGTCFTTPEVEAVDICLSLEKKQCKNDDSCKWDGNNCFGV